jgi:hypothetical protein
LLYSNLEFRPRTLLQKFYVACGVDNYAALCKQKNHRLHAMIFENDSYSGAFIEAGM